LDSEQDIYTGFMQPAAMFVNCVYTITMSQ